MIGVFDSGIGGLSILDKMKEMLPYEDFYYYADSKNNPYGEKSDEELFEITKKIVYKLKEKGAKLIVIACNTATVRTIKKLRKEYPELIFVGTVPAIKVACENGSQNTLVMATPATIGSERTEELVRDNKRADQNIYLAACAGLANAIETSNKREIERLLKEIFKDYRDKMIDTIVLGCTHYPFIKKEILKEMPGVNLVDGSEGVSREVKRQLQEKGLLREEKRSRKIIIYNSLTNEEVVD